MQGCEELTAVELHGVNELREAWSTLGHAYEPPIWDRMPDYDAYLNKVATNAINLALREPRGRIVANISFYANDLVSRAAFITQVIVDPSWQGHGLGTRLLAMCEARCVSLGMRSLRLEVRRDNEGAYRLYCRAGFNKYGETTNGYLMEKCLDDSAGHSTRMSHGRAGE